MKLRGDFCAMGEELLLGEADPGLWMAWLLLRPGTYRCTVVARLKNTFCRNMTAASSPAQQQFILTIPNVSFRGFHVANLQIV